MSKKLVFIYIGVAAVIFAFGRFTAPTKTVTRTVEVEKKVDTSKTDTTKNEHKVTKVEETKKPDGTVTTTTTTTVDSGTERKTSSKDIDKNYTSYDQETSRDTGRLNISALAGVQTSQPGNPLVYGVSVNKDILGPISVGVWGLSNSTYGASVGVSF